MNLTQLQLMLPSPIFTLSEAIDHCFKTDMPCYEATAYCMEQGFTEVTAREIKIQYIRRLTNAGN